MTTFWCRGCEREKDDLEMSKDEELCNLCFIDYLEGQQEKAEARKEEKECQ